jgi:hypothetical protein
VCSAANQDIDIHLPRKRSEHLTVTGRYDLLAVNCTYTDVGMVNVEREGKVVVLDSESAGSWCLRLMMHWKGARR